ncbi:alcohol dehydrogenase catalytic domain-containing protein [Actinomadura napierensis]|uniref:alcohol dehydrogenase n=1 Tax=Actinomadura napierensis TaxID=267854 RepID=A0ABN3AAV5_9ACTN
MRAWQFVGAHQPLQLIERPDPVPGPGFAVLDVTAAGMCHSDVGFLDGVIAPPTVPLILGHETAGVVSEIGPEVDGLSVGDRVVFAGDEAYAAGWTADGGFATKCLAPLTSLIRLPDSVSFVQGAAAVDAGATSYGGAVHAADLKAGDRIGIVGLGGLGMTGARLATLLGATVYAAEPRRETWSIAKERGVTDIVEDVLELAPLQLDTIVDFAGFGTTTAGAISAVRPGGLVVQVGVGRSEATISTAELTSKPVTLKGSRGGPPHAIKAVLDYMASGQLEIPATTVGFDEIPAALDRLRAGGVVGRLVATPNS